MVEMPKRREILAIVLIVLPWTLLITVWHQSAITPLLAIRKGKEGDGGGVLINQRLGRGDIQRLLEAVGRSSPFHLL